MSPPRRSAPQLHQRSAVQVRRSRRSRLRRRRVALRRHAGRAAAPRQSLRSRRCDGASPAPRPRRSRRRRAATTASWPSIDRSGRPFCFSVSLRDSISRSFSVSMMRIDHAVAGRAREGGVERRVLDDGGPPVSSLRRCASRMRCRSARSSSVTRAAATRATAGSNMRRTSSSSSLQVAAIGQDRRQRRDEAIDVELARERALAVARFEQADRLEHAQGVANRAAADAEARGEQALAPAAAGRAAACRRGSARGCGRRFPRRPGFS